MSLSASRAGRLEYVCSDCGAAAPKWQGRCDGCGAWNTLGEVRVPAQVREGRTGRVDGRSVRPARPLAEIAEQFIERRSSGLGEFDRVLGGGLVRGQAVLLAGEPGVGKSTLLLSVAHRFASAGDGDVVLYISGEESAEQVGVRARRIGADAPGVLLADESDLDTMLALVQRHQPALVVVDSVQTITSAGSDGRAGGVAQVLEVTQVLVKAAKASNIPLILVGQSTRENAVAGPRALEHLVDTILTFEGDRHTSLRLCRTVKNRYGPADEVACFEQVDTGLLEVPDPSELFRGHRDSPVPGTCVTVNLEGRRTVLAEVQSLVATSSGPVPRRGVSGLDSSRVAMLIAVTERSANLKLGDKDVFVASVGGAKLVDPATDLATCLAIASAAWKVAMPADVLALGEVALSGDIRMVSGVSQRVNEAVRLGYRRILVPPGSSERIGRVAVDVAIVELGHLDNTMRALRRLGVGQVAELPAA